MLKRGTAGYDAAVNQKLAEFFQWNRSLSEATRDAKTWTFAPGSSIEVDDAAAYPYLMSGHLLNQLHSAAEHIDAVARLLSGEHGVLHIRADYTLVRASIESAAMAHWALMPRDRTERVTRLLQIMHKDALDGARVLENKEQQRAVLAPTLARIREVAGREGLDAAACLKQFDAVSVLRWVSKRAQTEALFNWRLCSGMAHGKQWATQALSDREVVEQSGNVVSQKMTGRSDHLLIPCVAVYDILAQLLPVFHGRRGAVEHAPPQLGLRTATRTTS